MPVTGLGPRCHRCTRRPVLPADIEVGLCVPCARLERAVGRRTLPELTRFDVLLSAGVACRSDSPQFEVELRDWIGS